MLLPGLICLLFYFLPSIFSVPPKLIIIMEVTILNIKCFAGFLTETIYWFSVHRAYCIPLLPQSSVLLCLEIIFLQDILWNIIIFDTVFSPLIYCGALFLYIILDWLLFLVGTVKEKISVIFLHSVVYSVNLILALFVRHLSFLCSCFDFFSFWL